MSERDLSKDALVDAVEDYVKRSVMPLAKRILALEKELAAVKSGKNAAGDPVQAESFERRLSRNAEHVARLESRVKALETSGPRR